MNHVICALYKSLFIYYMKDREKWADAIGFWQVVVCNHTSTGRSKIPYKVLSGNKKEGDSLAVWTALFFQHCRL